MAATTTILQFDWVPDPVVYAEEFLTYAAELEDLAVPLNLSREAVAEDASARFDAEGPGWAQWSESYALSGQPGPAILDRTGDLKGHASDPSSYYVVGDTLMYAPESPVDAFHQEGTSRMPARPFIGLDEGGDDAVVAVFAAWLDSVIGAGAASVTPFGLRSSSTGRFMGRGIRA